MNIFGVGPAEAGLVFVIALIVVGPQRFPEIMRTAGRWYRIARSYSNEVMKDVRSAVDDIEREVRAETDDLKSVREFADLGADLKAAQEDAEQLSRETNAVLADRPATDPKFVRPSQRNAAASASAEAVPPIETPATTSVTPADDASEADAPDTADTPEAPKPAQPAASKAPATEAETPEAEKSTSTFDPFKREKPKKGPVLIPRESASSDGDERA